VLGCEGIKAVFEQQFRESHGVELKGGAREPLYLPAKSPQEYHQLIYTLDYPASALHELAHWCLASDEQLQLRDWGHWYVPDGRSVEEQRRFQRAEARVQALEWILSWAAGRSFRESSDNLSGEALDERYFKEAIHQQVLVFCEQGPPPRAIQLARAFARACQREFHLLPEDFPLEYASQ
jgi:elongation factor P hydroxylase